MGNSTSFNDSELTLFQPDKTYFSGERVVGYANVNLKKPTRLHWLTLTIRGKLSYTNQFRLSVQSIGEHSCRRNLLSLKFKVKGPTTFVKKPYFFARIRLNAQVREWSTNVIEEDEDLSPGSNSFFFSLQIPEDVEPSVVTDDISIKYKLHLQGSCVDNLMEIAFKPTTIVILPNIGIPHVQSLSEKYLSDSSKAVFENGMIILQLENRCAVIGIGEQIPFRLSYELKKSDSHEVKLFVVIERQIRYGSAKFKKMVSHRLKNQKRSKGNTSNCFTSTIAIQEPLAPPSFQTEKKYSGTNYFSVTYKLVGGIKLGNQKVLTKLPLFIYNSNIIANYPNKTF
ncbi:hypothetical protein ACOME3_005662 [Neoechinorhynchus agilis]